MLIGMTALLVGGAAQAQNAITLTPTGASAQVGGEVELELALQASDSTLGGGIRIHYDSSRLRFERFLFDPGLGADPQLQLQPVGGSDDEVLLVAFGHYDGLSGSRTIGTLTFAAIAEGIASFSTEADGFEAGPFVDDAGAPLSFSYGGAAVAIAAAVPGMGPAALLLTSLLLIAAVGYLGRRAARA
jgi:hypothetical protein